MFNLVITRVEGSWQSSIFLLQQNPDTASEEFFTEIEEVYQSAGLPENFTFRTSARYRGNRIWHCTEPKGHCLGLNGACDLCHRCVTIIIERVTLPPPEDYDTPTLVDPTFAYNGGGGGSSQTHPPQTTNPNPCEGITEKINTPDIKSKVINFKTPAVLNLNYEKGFNFAENAAGNLSYNPIDGNPNQTGIDFSIDPNGKTIGFIHSHFDQPNMSPIFTIEDIKSFNAIDIYRGINSKSRTNTCLMLVSRAGVFALVIENFALMKNYGDKLHDSEKFEELAREYRGDVSKMITDDDVIKQVLQVLPKYGVGLYKANDNLSGWNKLTYNTNNNSIIATPCN